MPTMANSGVSDVHLGLLTLDAWPVSSGKKLPVACDSNSDAEGLVPHGLRRCIEILGT